MSCCSTPGFFKYLLHTVPDHTDYLYYNIHNLHRGIILVGTLPLSTILDSPNYTSTYILLLALFRILHTKYEYNSSFGTHVINMITHIGHVGRCFNMVGRQVGRRVGR